VIDIARLDDRRSVDPQNIDEDVIESFPGHGRIHVDADTAGDLRIDDITQVENAGNNIDEVEQVDVVVLQADALSSDIDLGRRRRRLCGGCRLLGAFRLGFLDVGRLGLRGRRGRLGLDRDWRSARCLLAGLGRILPGRPLGADGVQTLLHLFPLFLDVFGGFRRGSIGLLILGLGVLSEDGSARPG